MPSFYQFIRSGPYIIVSSQISKNLSHILFLLPAIVKITLTTSTVWTGAWTQMWCYDSWTSKHENINKLWNSPCGENELFIVVAIVASVTSAQPFFCHGATVFLFWISTCNWPRMVTYLQLSDVNGLNRATDRGKKMRKWRWIYRFYHKFQHFKIWKTDAIIVICWLVFRIRKTYIVHAPNLKLVQIGRKAPPLFSAFWWDTQLVSWHMM